MYGQVKRNGTYLCSENINLEGKEMKLLYFLAHPDSMGGANKVMLTQAYIMRMHGNQVRAVIQNDDENKHIPEYEKICNLYELEYVSAQFPIATCIENIDIFGSANKYESIKKIVIDYSPDLIHSLQLNTVVEYIARELRFPHIMNIYQISEGMFNIKWLDVFPRYHSGDSYFYCNKWKQGLGIESRCIRVAYDEHKNTSDFKVIEKKISDRIELINIGVFTEYKRQLEIIKFVDKCKKNGYMVHISFLGKIQGGYAKECKEYVKSHDLDSEVTFTGFVVDIEKYLRRADLMVHASTSESYPGVVVEAMANRVPVLVTPVAGIPELVNDKVNGFLSNGYSANDLYDAFERYIAFRKYKKIDAIIDAAFETYVSNHTYDVAYKALNDYYLAILHNSINYHQAFSKMKDIYDTIIHFGKTAGIRCYSEEVQKNLWFIYHIKQIVDEKKYFTAVIWGAGHFGRIALEWCELMSLKVIGFIDSVKEGDYEGYCIDKPTTETITMADVLFLAIGSVEACAENIKLIEEAGKIRNVSYFLISNNPCIQAENR